MTWDPAAFAAWRQQVVALAAAAETAPDAPPEVKLRAETQQPGGLRAITAGIQKALSAKER